MAEALCPFGDGRHKRKPWSAKEPDGRTRSGFACVRCSKTWEYVGDVLFETYELLDLVARAADISSGAGEGTING